MGFFGPYEYKTKTGKKFYLHATKVGKIVLYYFSKDRQGSLNDIPHGYEIATKEGSDLPFLRKRAGPKKEAPKK